MWSASLDLCARYREGRKFRVRVRRDTPLFVWSARQVDTAKESARDDSKARSQDDGADADQGNASEGGAVVAGEDSGSPKANGAANPGDLAASPKVPVTASQKQSPGQRQRDQLRERSRVAPMRFSRMVWERPGEDLRLEFASELPRELEVLTFGPEFNSMVDGVKVRKYFAFV